MIISVIKKNFHNDFCHIIINLKIKYYLTKHHINNKVFLKPISAKIVSILQYLQ